MPSDNRQTPQPAAGRENKPHIGIFGRCNSGKSSLLNFIAGGDVAVVSPEAGTTTDVVRKHYEILGFTPVVFIDTPGIDDISANGPRRIERAMRTISQIDAAIVVFTRWEGPEKYLAEKLRNAAVPFFAVRNVIEPAPSPQCGATNIREHIQSAVENNILPENIDIIPINIADAKEPERDIVLDNIKKLLPENSYRAPAMFEGRVVAGDRVLLICPIDSEAPAGRLILPQVQAIRELLDRNAIPVVVQPAQISAALASAPAPVLAVTDSQVFPEARQAVPAHITLTSFSILLAAAKGDYPLYLKGLEKVDALSDGDRILIAENCSHQVSCEDIGREKIPRWLEEYSGRKLQFTFVSGLSPLPADIGDYALMVQCGGCMVTRSQLRNRIRQAASASVPVTNYGMLIRKIRR